MQMAEIVGRAERTLGPRAWLYPSGAERVERHTPRL